MAQLRLPPLPTVRDLLKLYKLHALKQLSQSFLLDSRITDKFVRAAGGKALEGWEVCEVGPGPGPITRSVLNVGVAKLVAIEKDERFRPTLELLADAAPGRFEARFADILDYDMSALFSPELAQPWEGDQPRISVVGNLPFSVSTPLIIRWLRDIAVRRNVWQLGRVGLTLTFQQEVAERIVARENDAQRCRLSIMCQAWCQPSLKFTIPGSAFVPKPDVDVGVVHLVPRVRPLISTPFEVAEKVARNIFGFRQKFCIRGAGRLFPVAVRESLVALLLDRANVHPETRPFQLRMSEMARLSEVYWAMCQHEPRLYQYNHRATLALRGEEQWENFDTQPLASLPLEPTQSPPRWSTEPPEAPP